MNPLERRVAVLEAQLAAALRRLEQMPIRAGGGKSAGLPRVALTVTQAGHGFAVGRAIAWNGSAWANVPAATVLDTDQTGIVEKVSGVDKFTVVLWGQITLSGLTPFADYYLTGSGGITTAIPATNTRVIMAAASATIGIVNPGRDLPGLIDMRNGNQIQFSPADFVGTNKLLKVREIDVCESGVAKKMLILASATY